MTEQQAHTLIELARFQLGLTFGVFVALLVIIVALLARD